MPLPLQSSSVCPRTLHPAYPIPYPLPSHCSLQSTASTAPPCCPTPIPSAPTMPPLTAQAPRTPHPPRSRHTPLSHPDQLTRCHNTHCSASPSKLTSRETIQFFMCCTLFHQPFSPPPPCPIIDSCELHNPSACLTSAECCDDRINRFLGLGQRFDSGGVACWLGGAIGVALLVGLLRDMGNMLSVILVGGLVLGCWRRTDKGYWDAS